jgi:translation elongation factor EF-Tu-like GTPase
MATLRRVNVGVIISGAIMENRDGDPEEGYVGIITSGAIMENRDGDPEELSLAKCKRRTEMARVLELSLKTCCFYYNGLNKRLSVRLRTDRANVERGMVLCKPGSIKPNNFDIF